MAQDEAGSALDGIRVVDLSSGTAGEIAAMWLGDFGAEVIRVEPDPATAEALPGAPMWGRNKTVISADPASSEVAALIAAADVVVTSTERVAALAASAGADNTRLVELFMPVYGVDEAVDSHTAAALMYAVTGLAGRQSSFDGGPIEAVYPHITYEQGAWAAACTIAALVERERSGKGQRVTVDGMHGALVASTPTMVVDPSAPVSSSAVGPGGPSPVYSMYKCSDGNWLFLGALLPKFQQNAFELLGTSDIATDPRLEGDPTKMYSPDNRGWVRQRLADAFATRPRDEWLSELARVDCPAGPVGDRAGWLDNPQIIALGQRREIDDPDVGPVVMSWVPVELSDTPALDPAPRRRAASAQWSPRDEPGAVGDGDSDGKFDGPLSGIRVIDLGTILAGPFSGMLLAELGADVVKVEPPSGDGFRVTGFQYNRGQRSLAIDLQNETGHDAFLSLAADTDVVIDNYRPGVLQRLRIDYDNLVPVREDIISVSITGFGDVGPMAGRPGFDPVLQATSGMMAAQGGDSEPVFYTVAVNDVTAACVSVVGVTAALYHRARTGHGQRVSASLCAVSAYMQQGELVRYAGREAPEVGGRDYAGPTALDHYYPTSDGHVRIHVPSADLLTQAGLLSALPSTDAELSDQIAGALKGLTSAQVVERLEAVGAAVATARTFVDMVGDQRVLDAGYFEELIRPDGHQFFVPGRYARFSRTEQTRNLKAPGLGEHTREVLVAAGRKDADTLIESGIAVQGGPMETFGGVGYR